MRTDPPARNEIDRRNPTLIATPLPSRTTSSGLYLRRTPVIEVDGADFGLGAMRGFLKLEFMQHAGSFKARGAFANLLLREVPQAGVVAASGGNHGVAVAYAAMRLGKRARIFVPSVASPAKMARIRECGAELVVAGERYADALAASEEWARASGALPVHAFDQRGDAPRPGQRGLGIRGAGAPSLIRFSWRSVAAVSSAALRPGTRAPCASSASSRKRRPP
jgi:hypothetical protein